MGARLLRRWLHRPERDRDVLAAAPARASASCGTGDHARCAQALRDDRRHGTHPGAGRAAQRASRGTWPSCAGAGGRARAARHARATWARRGCASCCRRRRPRTPPWRSCCRAPWWKARRPWCATAASSPPGYDAELDELRRLSEDSERYLADLEARERERTGIANLRLGYNRVHGYYIELPRAQADRRTSRLRATADAEERRALHHAGAEELRGQGAERPRACPRARTQALRGAAGPRCCEVARPRCSARPPRWPSSTCWPTSPSAPRPSTCTRPSWSTTPGIHIGGGRHPVVEQAIGGAVRPQRPDPGRHPRACWW